MDRSVRERLYKRKGCHSLRSLNSLGARLREQTRLRKEFGNARNLLLFNGIYREVTI